MADEQDTDEAEQGFLKRRTKGVKRYVGRRFGNQFLKAGYSTVKSNMAGTRKAMTPKSFDLNEFRQGIEGRYEDGGVARFMQMVKEEKIGEQELERKIRNHAWSANDHVDCGSDFFSDRKLDDDYGGEGTGDSVRIHHVCHGFFIRCTGHAA